VVDINVNNTDDHFSEHKINPSISDDIINNEILTLDDDEDLPDEILDYINNRYTEYCPWNM